MLGVGLAGMLAVQEREAVGAGRKDGKMHSARRDGFVMKLSLFAVVAAFVMALFRGPASLEPLSLVQRPSSFQELHQSLAASSVTAMQRSEGWLRPSCTAYPGPASVTTAVGPTRTRLPITASFNARMLAGGEAAGSSGGGGGGSVGGERISCPVSSCQYAASGQRRHRPLHLLASPRVPTG